MTASFLPLNLALNPIVVNVDAADPVAIVGRSGLRYFLQLMVRDYYGANTFSQLIEFEGSESPPESVAGGTIFRGTFFELQDQLESLLYRTAPTFGQTGLSVCDGLVTPYYVKTRIENNDVLLSEDTSTVQYAIKAGVAERDFLAYKDTFFTDFIGKNGRFLTWAEDGKRVQPGQPEFLYWLCNCSPVPAQLNLICEVITSLPDQDRDFFTVSSLTNLTPMTVFSAAVGPDALGLNNRTVPVAAYQVWLEDESGNRLTEVRTYRMDPEFRRNVRFILFANSLGGYDTISLTGQGEEEVKATRTVSDRYSDYSFSPQYAEKVIDAVTGDRQLTVNSGWMSQTARNYLMELVLTKDAYVVTDRAFLPLLPTLETIKQTVDDEGPIGRLLTFRYANPERNFSNLPISPAAGSVRPTGWRPKAMACLLNANGIRTGLMAVTMIEKYYLDTGVRVVNAPIKPNLPGSEGYIPPDYSLACQTTPFLSVAINRPTTVVRSNCPAGQVGGPATIVIPAGTYGSELSLKDANAKAEAEFTRLNTQAYVDVNGTCIIAPELYNVVVPADKWHYRSSTPTKMAVVFRNYDKYPVWGNYINYQAPDNVNTFAFGSNDLNFPATTYGYLNINVYGISGTKKRLMTYKNGVLLTTKNLVMNQDGYQFTDFLPDGFAFGVGDKFYFRLEDIV
ncbi:DUF5977 domain-containing protein [Spirosoma endophyticum]|uniref:DUF5977 domain-containing protein n=1 Tax=Spirosoma endophyticum TaxID=662367 RepID=A0A1I1SJB3_9BACT|nr:DUF5977 domain-containing protein [Spirosoma endophyticum]SFD46526.1 hypothetical protein SAMN05216167_105130 [Spirosoma endophyticum]